MDTAREFAGAIGSVVGGAIAAFLGFLFITLRETLNRPKLMVEYERWNGGLINYHQSEEVFAEMV